MFNAAKAALITVGEEPGTHHGVKTLVGRLVKEDMISKEYGRFYAQQQTYREQADYEPEVSFTREDLRDRMDLAHAFLDQMGEIVAHAAD